MAVERDTDGTPMIADAADALDLEVERALVQGCRCEIVADVEVLGDNSYEVTLGHDTLCPVLVRRN